MIQAKRTPVQWSSNPIKVNRWNFMSFVSSVASVKMAPLWPYDSMDSHWVGIWIPMVNGTWVSLISPTSWKKNTSSECWRAQDRIEIVRLVCKRQLPFLCFRSKYAMSSSRMKSSQFENQVILELCNRQKWELPEYHLLIKKFARFLYLVFKV